jgi:hypothetical protein
MHLGQVGASIVRERSTQGTTPRFCGHPSMIPARAASPARSARANRGLTRGESRRHCGDRPRCAEITPVQPPESAPPDPIDALIMRLVRDREAVATPTDVAAIVERIATAPFSRRLLRVPARDRGLTYGGITVERLTDSLDYHLVKRVRDERQWAEGTTAAHYLRDLRAAARHPDARVLVYARQDDFAAATMSSTEEIVALHRRGMKWLAHLLVVYSARHGTVQTGYMFSGIQELMLPEVVR